MNEIISFLANDNFIVINRDLIDVLGLDCAVFLSEIASEWNYWDKTGKAEEGWFFSTSENIQKKSGLSNYKQTASIKKLSAMGILEVSVKGTPATRYFRINEGRLVSTLSDIFKDRKQASENPQTSFEKFEIQFSKIQNPVFKNLKTSFQNFETKNNKEKVSKNNNKEKVYKASFGEYGNVLLTEKEYERLVADYGKWQTEAAVKYLDEYIEEKGYKSKSHNLAMRRWVFDAVSKHSKEVKPKEPQERLDWMDGVIDSIGGVLGDKGRVSDHCQNS